MGEFLFFLLIGLGSLSLVLLWAGRSAGPSIDGRRLSEVREAFTVIELELPSGALGERIFASHDWDFISANASREIQRTFLQERKSLAMSWLRQTRTNVGRVMEFHRKAVRGCVRLNPSLELRLALNYIVFLLTYEVLCALILLRGPFWVRELVRYTSGIADQMSYLSGHILVGMDPTVLGRIKSRWYNNPVAS